MLEIDKKEIKGVLGKKKGVATRIISHRLEGLEDLPRKDDTEVFEFIKHEKGLVIALITGLFSGGKYFYVLDENIISINLKSINEFQKDKSIIGRAAIGGLLLGPLGAVVGGVSGVGKNTTNDYLLLINYHEKNEEKQIIFKIKKQSKIEILHNVLNGFYPLKYNTGI